MFDISAPSRVSHSAIDPAILYLGTPVVLVATSNIDGSTNVAPMSSAWWLGWSCMLGFDATSHTVANLERAGECVLNLPSARLASQVDALAKTTGSADIPRIQRVHAHPDVLSHEFRNRIDPHRWNPLLMSFLEYFSVAPSAQHSRLRQVHEEVYGGRTPEPIGEPT